MNNSNDRTIARLVLALGIASAEQIDAVAQAAPGEPLEQALVDRGVLRLQDLERVREVLRIALSPGETPPTVLMTPGAQVRAAGRSTPPLPELERFELIGEVGRGGMGTVYRARQKGLDRTVALKVLSSGSLAVAEEVERFRREALAAAKLRHPGIVEVYDIGEFDGRPYIAMEFIEGNNLDDYVTLRRPSLYARVELIRCVAEAVGHAHDIGIVHRDLKPSNVLVDEDGRPHVADFGLAKEVSESAEDLTRTGQILGTPHYMSPEQARGDCRNIDARSDVYSLGAMLYEVMTGVRPFEMDDPVAVILKVVSEDPTPPRKLNPRIPPDLEAICRKALEKDRDRRYATGDALAADLGRFLGKQGVEARAEWSSTKLWRKVRRHPVTSALAGAIVLLALATGTLAVLYDRRAEEAAAAQGSAERERRFGIGWSAALVELAAARELLADPAATPAEIRAAAWSVVQQAGDLIRERPGEAGPLVLRGRALRLMGDRETADRDFVHALELAPGHAEAALERAWIAVERVLDERSLSVLPAAKDAATPCEPALVLLKAVPVNANLPRLEESLVAQWREFLGGDAAKVRAACDQSASRGGRIDRVLHLRAVAAGRPCAQGQAALADLDEAVRLVPHCVRYRIERGAWRRAAGNFVGAEEDYSYAIELGETSARLRHALGVVREKRGDVRGAISDYGTALQTDPSLVDAWLSRGAARCENGDAEGAVEDCTSALTHRGDLAEAYGVRGLAEGKLARWDRAVADLEQAVRLDPASAEKYAKALEQARRQLTGPGK